MICSSVNSDLFMVRSSSWAGFYHHMEELSGVSAGVFATASVGALWFQAVRQPCRVIRSLASSAWSTNSAKALAGMIASTDPKRTTAVSSGGFGWLPCAIRMASTMMEP